MSVRKGVRRLGTGDDDPLSGVANFFDLGVVFALGFLLALMTSKGVLDLAGPRKSSALAKNQATSATLEVLTRRGLRIERYRVGRQETGGEGVRLGTAFRLKNGDVIYVPDGGN